MQSSWGSDQDICICFSRAADIANQTQVGARCITNKDEGQQLAAACQALRCQTGSRIGNYGPWRKHGLLLLKQASNKACDLWLLTFDGNFPVGLVLLWGLKRGDFLAQKGAPKIGQKVAPQSQTKRKITNFWLELIASESLRGGTTCFEEMPFHKAAAVFLRRTTGGATTSPGAIRYMWICITVLL